MKIPSETKLENVRLRIDTLQRLYVDLDADVVCKLEEEGWHFWHEDSKSYLIVDVNAKIPENVAHSLEILSGPVDLVIEPYVWRVGSRSGVKAFIKSIEKSNPITPTDATKTVICSIVDLDEVNEDLQNQYDETFGSG
jgi:hypothetical protein